MNKTCFVYEPECGFPIYLTQQDVDVFTVAYGKEVTAGLSYNEAAVKLGAAIMHSAACAGALKTE